MAKSSFVGEAHDQGEKAWEDREVFPADRGADDARSVQDARPVDVVLAREQERTILRRLRERRLRLRVDLLVLGQLEQEAVQLARARELRHPQEEVAGGGVLRHGLERLQ